MARYSKFLGGFAGNITNPSAALRAPRIVARIAGLALFLLVSRGAAAQPIDPEIAAFTARVAAYVALHRDVERSLPVLQGFSDPSKGLAAAAALRKGIQMGRPSAREGELFGSSATVLRRNTRRAFRQAGFEARDFIEEMRADSEDGARPPVVNEPFSWALGNLMPSFLIGALPSLPRELQYRLVGPDLVLIDIDANLVVDILRDALIDSTR